MYGVPIETNAQGFRAREPFNSSRPEGVRRIAVLSDSFTVCAGVAFEDLLTTRLERHLNEGTTPLRTEVYNFAVGGHGILHHAASLEEVALGYNPDLVLLMLYPYNDLNAGDYDREKRFLEEHAAGGEPIKLSPDQRGWIAGLHVTQMVLRQGLVTAHRIPFIKPLLPSLNYDRTVERYHDRGSD